MPELSIVVPTMRRNGKLERVLDALERQTCGPEAFEVVVVNDALQEDPEAVHRLLQGRPYATRDLSADRPGASAARNVGWRAARAGIVLFLDDDVIPVPGLLEAHLRRHREHPGREVAVLGRVDWAREVPRTTFRRWLDSRYFHFGEIEGEEAGWGHLYTANVSFKRGALEAVDGFDAEGLPYLYEDLDLGLRMHRELGLRMLYAREALGLHLHEMRLEDWRQRIQVLARAEHAFCTKHPDVPPWWATYLRKYEHLPPFRTRMLRLAPFVSPRVPWLGPRVWRSVDVHFHQELAPAFYEAWEAAGAQPAGASSGGPK